MRRKTRNETFAIMATTSELRDSHHTKTMFGTEVRMNRMNGYEVEVTTDNFMKELQQNQMS